MPIGWTVVIIFGPLFILLGSGIYIAIGLGAVGIFSLELLVDLPGIIGAVIYNTAHSYVLAAVPLFLLMGELVYGSGLSQRLYSGVSKWTGVVPGGLLHSNIVSCSLFAAVSGSSVATAATVGSVAYPEQSARGYSRGLITGSLAAGGTLGILIPPSITMIIYGSFVSASVGKLFMGGVIPGIILSLMFMLYIGTISLLNPRLVEPRQVLTTRYFVNAITAFRDIWPILLIMVTIFGGIYGGVFTPTEAAAVACVESILLAAVHSKLNFAILKKASLSALKTSAMVSFIIIGAQILAMALSMLKIPAQLTQIIAGWELNRLMVWFFVVIMYLILGCLMDGISMMLLTLPVTFPLLINALGFDPIWFGVLLVLLVECGLITPPVGINVYVIHGISGGTNIMEVFKGVIPFFICMIILLVILTFIPELVLWLPGLMLGR